MLEKDHHCWKTKTLEEKENYLRLYITKIGKIWLKYVNIGQMGQMSLNGLS